MKRLFASHLILDVLEVGFGVILLDAMMLALIWLGVGITGDSFLLDLVEEVAVCMHLGKRPFLATSILVEVNLPVFVNLC
jgi:hypothetical protein